jgi:hypothetical protein
MSFFFRKKPWRCHSCSTETTMQTPSDKMLNQATLEFVFSLTVRISASLHRWIFNHAMHHLLQIPLTYSGNHFALSSSHYSSILSLARNSIHKVISYCQCYFSLLWPTLVAIGQVILPQQFNIVIMFLQTKPIDTSSNEKKEQITCLALRYSRLWWMDSTAASSFLSSSSTPWIRKVMVNKKSENPDCKLKDI